MTTHKPIPSSKPIHIQTTLNPYLYTWAREQALATHRTLSGWLRALVEEARRAHASATEQALEPLAAMGRRESRRKNRPRSK